MCAEELPESDVNVTNFFAGGERKRAELAEPAEDGCDTCVCKVFCLSCDCDCTDFDCSGVDCTCIASCPCPLILKCTEIILTFDEINALRKEATVDPKDGVDSDNFKSVFRARFESEYTGMDSGDRDSMAIKESQALVGTARDTPTEGWS